MTSGTSNRESDDDYKRVIARFDPNFRIVDGSCGILWVFQKRDGRRKSGKPRWTGRSYCRTRETLIRLYLEFCAFVDPEVVAILEQMPERHPRWGAKKKQGKATQDD
jgi:hypothetical protein